MSIQISQLEKELIAMGEDADFIDNLKKTYEEYHPGNFKTLYLSHLKEIMNVYYGRLE
jgi:hypothetical protein